MNNQHLRLQSHPAGIVLWTVIPLLTAWGSAGRTDTARAETPSIGLVDAAEQGSFNLGPAAAGMSRVFDSTAGREVLRLDYRLPEGSSAGIWAKVFGDRLHRGQIDVVRTRVRATEPESLRPIRITLEIKGSSGVQRVALNPDADGKFLDEMLDWPAIGAVGEVVVVLSPIGSGTAAGSLDLDVRFEPLPMWRKLSTRVETRMAGILIAGLLAAAAIAVPYTIGRRLPAGIAGIDRLMQRPAERDFRWLAQLRRDLVCGMAVVFIAALGIGIYALGEKSRLEIGWAALALAVGGAGIAEWLKFGLTGKHLGPAEVFGNILATGLLAASASSLRVLQMPVAWPDSLLLSRGVAALVAVVYHAANAGRLAWCGKHIGAVGTVLLVGTPYALGSLVLLQSGPLLGAWPAVVQALARVLVVFGFNVAVANGISLATQRSVLRSVVAHLAMFGVASAAVVGSLVADFGSGATVASWPAAIRLPVVLATTVLSQAGLWAEVYLLTGLVLDAIHSKAPSSASAFAHPAEGMRKAVVFSGTFMAILHTVNVLWNWPVLRELAESYPLLVAMAAGAAAFPLAKTVIESFDGSQRFLDRLGASYRKPILYLRGVVVGAGMGYAVSHAMAEAALATRVWFGFAIGVAGFAGIDLLADAWAALRGRGRMRPWQAYAIHACLGGFIGAAIGFYLDQAQVAVVVNKFHRYLAAGLAPEPFGVYPFVSKWGFLQLGNVTGGVNLLFAEALAGVISWSVPAWLFAINRTFMAAYFRRDAGSIRSLFSADGMVALVQNMIEVLRWGLWMSPIINSFLRPMGDPTWYNQDGAIRTLIAIFQDATLSPEAFRTWSLHVFVLLLAYDVVRIVIWLDHMGLRVATLVNLSFLGMDRLDERLARLLGRAATARCIPEGVKRFTTWAPLLIPFYIPRGADWDYAWSQSEALQRAAQGTGLLAGLASMAVSQQLILFAGTVLASTAAFASVRWLRGRRASRSGRTWTLSNLAYEVIAKPSGEVFSHARSRGYDVSRRAYDAIDPAGRALFVVDAGDGSRPPVAWPVLGNYPGEVGPPPQITCRDDVLSIGHLGHDVRVAVDISLPEPNGTVELWTITVENLADADRRLKVVPYLEWVLNRPDADRGHTQYNRLFAQTQHDRGLHAVLAWDMHSRALGILAADAVPQGVLTSRVDFLGRARSLWTPVALETLGFAETCDTRPLPTFDPIGSLLLDVPVKARGTAQLRLLVGHVGWRSADAADAERQAVAWIERHLRGAHESRGARRTRGARGSRANVFAKETCGPRAHLPAEAPSDAHSHASRVRHEGHGGAYWEFSADGRTLAIGTPFTPRPVDHVMSNACGHVMLVTNRGLHNSSNGNSQQNRLTPDWPDTVTREVPAEAFYLYEPERHAWYSPTYHPQNDAQAAYRAEFGVDGTAVYRMTRGTLATELTAFVPPDEPLGVYLLTVRNGEDRPRRIRLGAYFQMVLADQPEHAGPLTTRVDRSLDAIFVENPRNRYRTGPAFVATSRPAEAAETVRGRFFGEGRGVAAPYLVERGEPDAHAADERPIAALLTTLELPAHGETTVVVVLGQADDRPRAEALVRKYRDPEAARESLDRTRRWWLRLMDTVRVETSVPRFDQYLDWMKYQALAERIWARRGFYQSSGAYGFRDQLQDSVNLMWADPAVARRQIVLHAAQQFLEGDVVHWFHVLQDGRTGLVARTHASDNLLWLPWAVAEYVAATGDESLLDEPVPYLEAEQPLPPLPAGKHGMGFDPLRSSRTDSVYRHCTRAIDLVLGSRIGRHGLPLIGTGDWNDGLDEIGSRGKGESVWLGFFLYYILDRLGAIVERRDGEGQRDAYRRRAEELRAALERTWRGDRYLRAIHDDGTEIGVPHSGVWEIDALTAAWAVMSGINPERGRIVFDTALSTLEKDRVVLLGWPPLDPRTKPYLGRSSQYPEGVRENGMYCHGVQWLIGAARLLAEQCQRDGQADAACGYRQAAYRLWQKISPIPHTTAEEIEVYGGQPNKQAADLLTAGQPGRMIWHGYTGAAGWMFRQALEGVLGARLVAGRVVLPDDAALPRGELSLFRIARDVAGSSWSSTVSQQGQ